MRDSSHLDFSRNRNLFFDVFSGMAGPLGDDVHVIVGNIGIGIDGKIVKRDHAPCEHQGGQTKNDQRIFKRKIDDAPDHCASSVASS